jgi:uncharacterized damage-inducible protein DinB
MDHRNLIITRLAEHVDELRSFTQGLTEQQLKERPAKEQWSLHELVMHLIEMQDVFIQRLTKLLVEEKPTIEPFEPDDARKRGLFLMESLEGRLATFLDQRATLVKLLQTLSEQQWQLEGVHPEIRHYTVEKCMESLMRHEEHHLYQMFNVFFRTEE